MGELVSLPQETAPALSTDTNICSAGGVDRRPRRTGCLALCRILHRQHPQPQHTPRLCPRMHPVLCLCEDRGLTLTTIRPHDVATYIDERHQSHSAPDVKQQLAALRMMFDWLITGQIVSINSAAAVRGPKYVVKTGLRSRRGADKALIALHTVLYVMPEEWESGQVKTRGIGGRPHGGLDRCKPTPHSVFRCWYR
jgi:hypothetical protein